MPTPPDSESASTPAPNNNVKQDIDDTQGQIIAQMMGGLAIGQLKLYLHQAQTPPKARETDKDSVEIGQNPYQGLKAFREMDGDRFFGRDTQIKKLWERFQQLHGDRTTIRVLPIYGPSGSGKSSLARAGLIPALGKQPLPGKDQGRVVVITPGNDPLEALATVLARIATKDLTPVAKTREFKNELLERNTQQEFDGLRRIANVFPNITDSPLIVLVDQFEELYTLCDDEQVRSAFVENLLCAASDSSQRVSVIITMRSDFLGKTQQHPRLNQLFSSQGFLVPIMQPEELEIAITEPAKRAGYELDRAVVELLITETKGQEGALPLLQFALTQIWEGLRKDVKPVDTLKQIGGVGGALANEAKRLYHSLTPEQQTIARSTFLALIQLNDDHKATRRRAPFSELITSEKDVPLVREVIERFARPGVWILVTFSNEQQVEMVEVAHEALIRNWEELQDWLNKHWEKLLKKRKIEQFALDWQYYRKSKDYLLQGRVLRDAKEFLQAQKENTETSLSGLAKEFVQASRRKQIQGFLKVAIIPLMGTLIPIHFFLLKLAQTAIQRKDIECKQDFDIPILVRYLVLVGQKDNLEGANFCNDTLNNIDLSESTLWGTNFRGSHLANTDLQGANLREADFQGANLLNTNFSKAFLEKANFQGSLLYKTNLQTTNELQQSQIEQSLICKAKLPSNFIIDPDRDCKKLGL
ncbi:MAG: pentapeptide repeat-containing protein [Crinalium sp.]